MREFDTRRATSAAQMIRYLRADALSASRPSSNKRIVRNRCALICTIPIRSLRTKWSQTKNVRCIVMRGSIRDARRPHHKRSSRRPIRVSALAVVLWKPSWVRAALAGLASKHALRTAALPAPALRALGWAAPSVALPALRPSSDKRRILNAGSPRNVRSRDLRYSPRPRRQRLQSGLTPPRPTAHRAQRRRGDARPRAPARKPATAIWL
jgi:hypothetical protein